MLCSAQWLNMTCSGRTGFSQQGLAGLGPSTSAYGAANRERQSRSDDCDAVAGELVREGIAYRRLLVDRLLE
jgi:hypothetical protein